MKNLFIVLISVISVMSYAGINDGLVAYYPFNGNANDESGNVNDGTVNGAVLTADRFGNTNSAYSFDGNSDFIEIQNEEGLRLNAPFTLSAWLKLPGDYSQNGYVLVKSSSTDGHMNYGIRVWNDYRISFRYYQDWSTPVEIYSTKYLEKDIWHHSLAMHDEDSVYIMVDNEYKVSLAVASSSVLTTTAQEEQNLGIGKHIYGGGDIGCFYGNIDNIRIYGRALTESEIDSLYHEGGRTLYETDTVTDIDANVYQTVKIGDQTWMAENLKVTHYRNGNAISKILNNTVWSTTSEGAYCNYENNDSNADIYGSLYNWYAINDSRGIAPEGWHVPSDEEWKELEMCLGMSQSVADAEGLRGTDEGTKLKSTSGWNSNGNGTDSYGFTALPAGYRFNNGDFDNIGDIAYFWSSSDGGSGLAWHRYLSYSVLGISRYHYGNQRDGFSVRCVKDSEPSDLVAYYPFNGNANDESGNGNHGDTTDHAPTLINDRFGNENSAYSFDGVDDYIQIPNSESFNIEDAISISYWVKLKTSGPYYFPHHIIGKYDSWGSGQRDWGINFDIVSIDTGYAWWGCTGLLPEVYYNITMTFDGSLGRIYKNRVLINSMEITGPIHQTNSDIMIGEYLLGGNYYFDGVIDDIRIYNRALTDSEIDSLYREGGWAEPQSSNLIVNPIFENGLDNWNPYSSGWSSSTNNPHSGLKCAEFNFSGGSGYYDASMKQTGDHLYVQAGIPYLFSFWRRETDTHDTHTTSETILDVDLILNGVNYSHPMPNMSPSNTWVQIDTTITFLENGYVYIDFQLHGYATSNSAVFAVDDIILCQITENSTVTIPTLSTYLNDTVLVPVNVEFPTGKYYDSAELTFSGYQNGLNFIGVDTSSSMTGGAGWNSAVNETGDSLIISWFAGAEGISGSGVFCWLKFVATGEPCNFKPINIESALFNTGEDQVSITNGGIYIKPIPFYGDVDSNGEVQAHDAALILKHVIEVEILDCQELANADVTEDGTVSALDASVILRYGVGLINDLPYDTSVYGSLMAAGEFSMEEEIGTLGGIFELPILIENGNNIFSFEGCLEYDPQCLMFSEFQLPTDKSDYQIQLSNEDGKIQWVGAGTNQDGASGIFITACFDYKQEATEHSTTVSLLKMRINEEVEQFNIGQTRVNYLVGIDSQKGLPDKYALSQNYPNPFNPITVIEYALPKTSNVQISIFDVNGRVIDKLVNRTQQPGYYSVQFDASSYSSGVYFYQILAGNFQQVKKMLLIK